MGGVPMIGGCGSKWRVFECKQGLNTREPGEWVIISGQQGGEMGQ